MKEYVSEKYKIRELSAISIEFIKQDLKGLLIAPVDVSHYKSLIELIRETDTASLSEGNENLFFNEIESILKRHLF